MQNCKSLFEQIKLIDEDTRIKCIAELANDPTLSIILPELFRDEENRPTPI